MNDTEFGLTNSGDRDVVQVPAERKDHTNDPKLTDKKFKELVEHEEATTKDVVGPLAISPALLAKKKRGRPAKKIRVKLGREFYCATCRVTYPEQVVMKMGAGENRSSIFCGECQKFLGFFQPDVDVKIDHLIKNNPVKS